MPADFPSVADGVSIHWHGFSMRGYEWYDGTGRITQCPIAPGTNFTYYFQVGRRQPPVQGAHLLAEHWSTTLHYCRVLSNSAVAHLSCSDCNSTTSVDMMIAQDCHVWVLHFVLDYPLTSCHTGRQHICVRGHQIAQQVIHRKYFCLSSCLLNILIAAGKRAAGLVLLARPFCIQQG